MITIRVVDRIIHIRLDSIVAYDIQGIWLSNGTIFGIDETVYNQLVKAFKE